VKRREKGAIDLYEEAVYLVRRAPLGAIGAYYAGTLPFILGFLFFWAEMSQSPFAYDHCAPAALGLALLYFWMLYCQSIFVQRLRAELSGQPQSGWFSPEIRQLGIVQFALQPLKLFVLPVAALTLLAFPNAYAFYQNLMALPPEASTGFSRATAAARKQAMLWQQQNWILLAILALMYFVVFINIATAVLLLPYLLKMLVGIESTLTRSGGAILNTTFLAITLSLTYLVANPLAKAVYLLRCFYGESLETGEDLRAELRAGAVLRTAGTVVTIVIACGLLLHAQPAPAQPSSPSQSQVEDLNRAIDSVIHRAEFTWRLPRAARPPAADANWFVRTTVAFVNAIGRGIRQLGRWFKDFLKWLIDQLKVIMPGAGGGPGFASTRLRLLMFALLAGVAVVLGLLIWRTLRQEKRPKAAIAIAVASPVEELNDANLTADQKPLDQWLELARECIARQELRLALRALYLAGLAHLADRSLIAIHRSKSNQDYARELRRKARTKPSPLVDLFGENLGVFERTWYGLYPVDLDTVERFQSNLMLMRGSEN